MCKFIIKVRKRKGLITKKRKIVFFKNWISKQKPVCGKKKSPMYVESDLPIKKLWPKSLGKCNAKISWCKQFFEENMETTTSFSSHLICSYIVPNTRKRLCKQVLREIKTKRKERKEYAQIVIMTKWRAANVFKEVLKINSNPYISIPCNSTLYFFSSLPFLPYANNLQDVLRQ